MSYPEKLGKEIDDLWNKHLPLIRSRIETLQLALDALRKKRLTQDLREEAARSAHKLAGSLGTFGLQGGSDAATEIERLLMAENNQDFPIGQLSQYLSELKTQVENQSRLDPD